MAINNALKVKPQSTRTPLTISSINCIAACINRRNIQSIDLKATVSPYKIKVIVQSPKGQIKD